MGRWIDISMAVKEGLRTNHSQPGQELRITYDVTPENDPGGVKTVRRISTRLHIGTHIDGPEHLVLHGARLDTYPVDRFVGRAWVVDMYDKVPLGKISAADLEKAAPAGIQRDDILIIRTGWNGRYFEPDFFTHSPYCDPDAADWCLAKGFKLVAIDFLCDPLDKKLQTKGPDAFKTALLAAGVPVMTNADNLAEVKSRQVTLYAFPLLIVPSEAAPTRAVVWED